MRLYEGILEENFKQNHMILTGGKIMNNNEILNYKVLDNAPNNSTVSSTSVVTELVAAIPNAISSPIQRYHEVEVKKEVSLKMLEHRTRERETLCDLMLELAKLDKLDSEKFQTIMVAYGMRYF